VTRYVYAGGPAPVAEINVTANTEKDFIQANGRTWGVMEATSNTYFHHDAIGSVVALSNDSGQVTDTYEYEPFGKVLQHQGTSTNDYQFVGGYGVRKLNDTLDTMGVRQYSETVGRFTTQDPESSKNFDSDADWSGAFGGEGNISAGSVQILSLVSTRVKVPQGPVVVFDGWLSVSIGWGGFYFETTWIPGPTLFK
jgi:RHS repeat-associated protein